MHNQDLRNEYFSKKNTYMIFHAILTVLRCIGLLLIVAIIIFVSLYSTISNGQTEWKNTFDSLSEIARIIVPTELSLWIICKIIVVVLKRKLQRLKWKAEIVDEI